MATYQIPLGNDRIVTHRFTDDGSVFDLTGSTVYWRLKADRNDADADAVLTKSWIAGTESGLTLTDPETGAAVLATAGILYNHITVAQGNALTVNKRYAYDLKLIDTNILTTTLESGTLTILSAAEGGEAAAGLQVVTLAELRRKVARRLGDHLPLRATSNGTTTTFIDALNVNSGTEDMKGRIIVLDSDGTVHRITTMVDSTSTLTFTPAASATAKTAALTKADMYNNRGKGFRPDQYDSAINDAITDAWPLGKIDIVSVISSEFDSTTPEITVPSSMTHIHTVEWCDDEGDWHVLMKATRSNEYGWRADPASGQIRLHGIASVQSDGFVVRISGSGRQGQLVSDSDTCLLSPEYIVARACYHLTYGNIDRDEKYAQTTTGFEKEAKALRMRLRRIERTDSELVRSA